MILSQFTIVVNNDVDNGWTIIFDKFKKEIPEISTEINDFFALVNGEEFSAGDNDFLLSLANDANITDTNFRSFLETWDRTGDIAEEYRRYMQSSSAATSAFNATLKSVAANIGIMLAINAAIKIVSTVWDTINVTAAETQEKIDEITASLAELNSEYDSLSSRDIDSLSQSEKERLEYLEDRIAKEEELLKIQEAKKAEEEIGGGFTDYFDKDSYTRKLSDEKFGNAGMTLFDLFKGGSSDNLTALSANTLRSLKDYKNFQEDMLYWTNQMDGQRKLVELQISNFQIPNVKTSPYPKQPSAKSAPAAATPSRNQRNLQLHRNRHQPHQLGNRQAEIQSRRNL